MSAPYPSYCESGVDWLGHVPDTWTVLAARRCFRQARMPASPDDEQLSATQSYGVLPQKLFMEEQEQKVVLALSGTENFRHVNEGDFVISLRSFQGGIELSRYEGCVSPAYTVLKPISQIDREFYRYLLKSDSFINKLQSVTSGIRDGRNVSYDQFASISIPLPPASEQQAIAAFLDRETGKIDALVEEQRRLIALLREKRQAVISHAVTKGLDPTAPTKPSGVEWLGDVPAHWKMKPVKHLIKSFEQGWSPQCDGRPAEDGEWGVLKVGCVNGGSFRPSENKALPENLAPEPDLGVKKGDVLISRANTRELVGSAAVAEDDFERLMICDKIYRLTCREEQIIPMFFVRLLSTPLARQEIELEATGASASMLNIGQATIRELRLPVPPVGEQENILYAVNRACKSIDSLIVEVETAIALLQERRSALISAAVTGKIDVRSLVPETTEAA